MDAIRIISSLVGLAIFVYLVYDVWKSPMQTGPKVGWTIFALLCGLIALVVWLITGKKRAYAGRM